MNEEQKSPRTRLLRLAAYLGLYLGIPSAVFTANNQAVASVLAISYIFLLIPIGILKLTDYYGHRLAESEPLAHPDGTARALVTGEGLGENPHPAELAVDAGPAQEALSGGGLQPESGGGGGELLVRLLAAPSPDGESSGGSGNEDENETAHRGSRQQTSGQVSKPVVDVWGADAILYS